MNKAAEVTLSGLAAAADRWRSILTFIVLVVGMVSGAWAWADSRYLTKAEFAAAENPAVTFAILDEKLVRDGTLDPSLYAAYCDAARKLGIQGKGCSN